MSAGSPTYPVKTIAKLLLLTDRRVQQLAKEGVIPKADRGRYELAPAVQGYVRYMQERLVGQGEETGTIDYHKEKARKMKADADMAEMEAARARDETIDAEELQTAWAAIVAEVRANLLNNTPARIAALAFGAENETELKAIVKDEIAMALRIMSETNAADLLEVKGAGDGQA